MMFFLKKTLSFELKKTLWGGESSSGTRLQIKHPSRKIPWPKEKLLCISYHFVLVLDCFEGKFENISHRNVVSLKINAKKKEGIKKHPQ